MAKEITNLAEANGLRRRTDPEAEVRYNKTEALATFQSA
jgi:hypothetical protein